MRQKVSVYIVLLSYHTPMSKIVGVPRLCITMVDNLSYPSFTMVEKIVDRVCTFSFFPSQSDFYVTVYVQHSSINGEFPRIYEGWRKTPHALGKRVRARPLARRIQEVLRQQEELIEAVFKGYKRRKAQFDYRLKRLREQARAVARAFATNRFHETGVFTAVDGYSGGGGGGG